jgi:hypothetical protein
VAMVSRTREGRCGLFVFAGAGLGYADEDGRACGITPSSLLERRSACRAGATGIGRALRMTRPSHPRHTPEQLELFTFGVGQQPPGDSRVGLIKTLQYRVRASSDLPLSVRIELRAILERFKSTADDDDTKVIAACRSLRDAAPRIWAESRSVLDALIGQRARLTLEIEEG